MRRWQSRSTRRRSSRLVDEGAELEQLGDGLHLHRGAAVEPRRQLPPLQRHARRRPPPLGRGSDRRHRGRQPVQQGQRHDLRPRRAAASSASTSRARSCAWIPTAPAAAARSSPSHYEGKELNSPNDVVVKSDGAIYFTDPTYGRMPGFGLEREQDLDFQGVYRIAPGGGDPQLRRRRLRPAQRPVLLGRRVAALHQRHRPGAHPRLRRRGRRDARERARLRRRHRHRGASRSATSSTA